MANHADVQNLSEQVFSTITRAGSQSFLTDAGVAAANTKQGLIDFINSRSVHADQENYKQQFIRVLQFHADITDANILSLTTVAGLAQLVGVTSVPNTIIME